MRIVLVSHFFPPHVGGIEAVVAAQAEMLARRGHDVTVVTTAQPGPAGRERHPSGFDIVRVPAINPAERFGVPFPVPAPRAWRQALDACGAVDVVHVHDLLYPTTWFTARWADRAGIPLFLHQHVAVVHHPNPVVEAIQRVVYRSVGTSVARRVSVAFQLNDRVRAMLEDLGVESGRIRFVPNGVDPEVFRPVRSDDERADIRHRYGLPANEILVAFVARPVPKKGYDILLASGDPAYRFVIVGGAEARTAGGDRAIHLGARPRSEVAEILRSCDVMALPSTAEGFPLTVQEAMASGLAVVTTDDEGYASYHLDRSLVRLVSREPTVVRAALREISADPDLRGAMGAYGIDHARRCFSWAQHADALEIAYTTAADGRSSRRGSGTR